MVSLLFVQVSADIQVYLYLLAYFITPSLTLYYESKLDRMRSGH